MIRNCTIDDRKTAVRRTCGSRVAESFSVLLKYRNSLKHKTSHSQLVDQKFNSISTKSFSEDVCQLILRIDKVKFDYPILNMLLDKVKSGVYMLGYGMLNVVAA
ncbi:hypothetical protein Tco_1470007 [Tanacetum coccineum]